MKYSKVLCSLVALLLLLISATAFAVGGDLQVSCEPGVRIFVDGVFRGKTNKADNGLFVEGLRPGKHTLKAVKMNYKPVVKSINITEGEAVDIVIHFIELREKTRKLAPEVEESTAEVGRLQLRSVPLGATVYLDGQRKGTADIEIDNVKVGRHTITFQEGGQQLTGTFSVRMNETLKLKGHFKKHKIINISEMERVEEEERARQEAEQQKMMVEEQRQREENARLEQRDMIRSEFDYHFTKLTVTFPCSIRNVTCEVTRNADLADGAMTYDEALSFIQKLNSENYAGHNDWRLPEGWAFLELIKSHYGNEMVEKLSAAGFENVRGEYWMQRIDCMCFIPTRAVCYPFYRFGPFGKGYQDTTDCPPRKNAMYYVWPIRIIE